MPGASTDAMKANCMGHCQWCDKLQKLPNGRLSTHGYSVKYQMFAGICMGSQNLPYELSCELVKQSIIDSQGLLENLISVQKRLLDTNNQPEYAWFQCYDKKSSKYFWEKIEISVVDEVCKYRIYGEHDKGEYLSFSLKSRVSVYSESPSTLKRRLNLTYVEREIKPQIKELEEYIKVQRLRVINWKEASLLSSPTHTKHNLHQPTPNITCTEPHQT